jgi:hypothetical protein
MLRGIIGRFDDVGRLTTTREFGGCGDGKYDHQEHSCREQGARPSGQGSMESADVGVDGSEIIIAPGG